MRRADVPGQRFEKLLGDMDVAGFQVNDTLDHLQHRRLCDVVGARLVEQALQHRNPVYDPYQQRAMRASIGSYATGIAGHSCQVSSLAEPPLLRTALERKRLV